MPSLNFSQTTMRAIGRLFNTPFKRGAAALAVLIFGFGIAVAVAPPAGSVIGNQATATYTDSTGNVRTSTSNLVQTTVAQVNSYTLTAGATKSVAPGGTVYFPHTITNTGNGADTYTLTAVDAGAGPTSVLCTGGVAAAPTPAGCNVLIYPDADGDGVADSNVFLTGITTPLVAAGSTYKFVMGVVWPAATPVGTETINLTALSVGGANGSAAATAQPANIDVINATLGAVINTTKSLSVTSGPRGVTTKVALSYTNTGGLPASLTLVDPLPTGMVYVAASGRWTGCAAPLSDATGAEVGVGCAGAVTFDLTGTTVNAFVTLVAPGESGKISFDVTIAASAAVGTSTTTNTATFSTDGGPAVSTNPAAYNVLAAASVVVNNKTSSNANTDELTQTATDNQVVVALADQGSTVYFANAVWNTGNVTDTFDMTKVSQTFPAGTTIAFYSDTAATCPAATPASGMAVPATLGSLLTDSNGNGTADTGPIAAAACKLVWTKVTLLSNTTGGPYSLVKKATSVNDPSASDTVTDVLTAITARVVDLTNSAAAVNAGTVSGTGSGFQGGAASPAVVTTNTAVNPGATTRFNLIISNTTGAAGSGDNYDLTAWNDYATVGAFTSVFGTGTTAGYSVAYFAGACPATGIATGAAITNTGNVTVGSSVNICAQVTVPGNATTGTKDIFFRVESQASVNYTPTAFAGFDVKHDAFVVASTSVVTIVPDRSGSSVPGGNVAYTHQVCNQGNTAAYVGLTSSNSAPGSFNNGLWLDMDASATVNSGDVAIPAGATILVPANACVNIIDNVFVSAGAATGATNVTSITASISTVAPTTLPTAGVVGTALGGVLSVAGTSNDTTVVVTSDVTLLKEQREVTCTGGGAGSPVGTANGAFVAGNLPLKVLPGACLQYRITAANSGVTQATNLTISDTTPSYTAFNSTACAATGNTGTVAAVVTAPANGATGALTTAGATLTSLATVKLVFCVQVAQ